MSALTDLMRYGFARFKRDAGGNVLGLVDPKSGSLVALSGTPGAAGKSLLTGSGAPSGATGSDGDSYLDLTAMVLYPPKANGAWAGSGVQLKGAAGNTIITGITAPTSGQGKDGDVYMNIAGSMYYGPKAGGAWPAGVTMVAAGGGGAVNAISSYCKYFYPWARDVANNVLNKGPNAGDAVKRGVAANVMTAGSFVSVAGTYGAGGTGRYWQAPAGNSHFDPAVESAIIHMVFSKMQPASGTEYIAGSQINSSTPGVQVAAVSNGNLSYSYKPGAVQNTFSSLTGLLDGVRHHLTFVFDRLTKTGYLYADGVLRVTKPNFDMTGAAGTPQGMVFGGYSGTLLSYDSEFSNCQMYAVPKDVADMNIQALVDKMMLYAQPLTVADLGA